ncbi:MAG: RNA methyltransferase [Clostridia bacterium]|nr:RNA methyltransferase [Clostridia bacterium]
MIISSRQNSKIKRIASLKEKKFREEYGEYLVEGVKMVREAVLSGMPVVQIAGVGPALSEVPSSCAEVIEVDENVFGYLSETKTPQGVIAVLKKPENLPLPPSGNCAVFDGVSDPGNLGTMIRTAAALGIKDLYTCNCADAYSPKAVRASMSGIYRVAIRDFDRQTVLGLLSGVNIAVADMGGESIFNRELKKPYALVIGNEANGVSEFFRAAADEVVSLPMKGNVESLNAAVAFSVIAYTVENK